MVLRIFVSSIFSICIIGSSIGQQFPTVEFVPYADGLSSPVDVVGSPFGNSDLYVVQRGATSGSASIRIVRQGALLATPFLTVTGISCCGERGLLSMVFHPDVATNGTFFVFYTAAQTGALTIARYKLLNNNTEVADPNSRVVILSIPHPSFSNHNGGKLIFGPDGFLYLGTGDGGGSNDPSGNAQNPQTLLGKLLRINPSTNSTSVPHYTIPPDNPYASPNDGVLDEIYAMGLRNPWRWSFDRANGNAWIADVGQNTWEELNFVSTANLRGANFGWRCFEGLAANNASGIQPCNLYSNQPHTPPVYVYPHNTTSGGFSVTGGYAYHGAAYTPLQGHYIMADYVTPAIWLVKTDGSFQANRQTIGVPAGISGFGETADGELWAISLNNGRVYSIRTETALSANPVVLNGFLRQGQHILTWHILNGDMNDVYTLEYRDENYRDFEPIARIASKGKGNQSYQFIRKSGLAETNSYYRLKVEIPSGNTNYSKVITVENKPAAEHSISMIAQGDRIQIFLPEKTDRVSLIDLSGRLLTQLKVSPGSRIVSMDAQKLRGQVIIIQAFTTQGMISEKFLIQR